MNGSVTKCLIRKCLVAKCLVRKCLDSKMPKFKNAQVQKCLGSKMPRLTRERKMPNPIFQSYITMKIQEFKKNSQNFLHQKSATLSSPLLLETCLGWSVRTRGSPRLQIVTNSSTLPMENRCLLQGGDVPNAIAKLPSQTT